jgi:hypothetical protein
MAKILQQGLLADVVAFCSPTDVVGLAARKGYWLFKQDYILELR